MPADLKLREVAKQWYENHRDDYIESIWGAQLDTHAHYDVPAMLATFGSEVRAQAMEEAAKIADEWAEDPSLEPCCERFIEVIADEIRRRASGKDEGNG
jgi:hypothetical protein